MWKFNRFSLKLEGIAPIHPTTKITDVLGELINII